MGRPNKPSGFSDKLIENYGSADYFMGFETDNDGSLNRKYSLEKVADYTLKHREMTIGNETKTVGGFITSANNRINQAESTVAALSSSVSSQSTQLVNLNSKVRSNDGNIGELQTDLANNVAALTQMNNKINAIESGPLVAETASQMTNTSKVYVYVGNEENYTNGDWYYYNGSRWVSGGAYNAQGLNLDTTLTVEGLAPDSKAVGDAISAASEEIREEISDLNGALGVAYDYEVLFKENQPGQVYPYTVVAGKTYIVKNLTTGININLRTCTSDGTEIETIKNSITPGEEVLFNATQNASYVRLYSTGTNISAMIGVLGIAFDKMQEISYIEKAVGLEWDKGHFISSTNGNTGNATDRSCSGFIPCPEMTSVSYVGENNKSTVYGIAFYDKWFKCISGDSNSGTLGNETTVTSPAGTAYLRISTLNSMLKDSYFKINNVQKTSIVIGAKIAINATIYVDGTNGNDSTGNGSETAPYKTISKAIYEGATKICIFPGTYYETISVTGRDIHLFARNSEWDDSVPNRPKAVISGNGTVATAVTIQEAQNVILEDIIITGCTFDGCLINKCQSVSITGCEFSSNGRNGIVCNYSNGVFRDCVAHDNANDGFNLNYYGDTQFFNCSGYDNGDDGISHHQGCTGLIDGGEWYGNVKGGVASPCHGAKVDVINVYSHNNGFGIYAHAGIASTSAIGRTFRVWNCVLTNNSKYGLSVQKNSAIIYENKISGNTEGQTAASVDGTITVLD